VSDFQVGDRVSVEGVLQRRISVKSENPCGDPVWEILLQGVESAAWMYASNFTLVERPKRNLRVGSVWERWGVRWVVGFDEDGRQLVNLASGGIADVGLIDASPDAWREVPVEELEREAGQ
jgi:hypothetical protein